MDPVLTLILATRNDNYNGDPMARLRASLSRTLANAGDLPVEIIVCDWGSADPVMNVIGRDPRVAHIHVSQAKANAFATPFYETKALNIAARAAEGKWIGRMDQDTIIGKRFFDWFSASKAEAGSVYFSPRRQLPEGVITEQDGNNYNDPPTRTAYDSAVGILLMERATWHQHRGYCEALKHFNHMEVEFLQRLEKHHPIRFFAPEIDMPFYHIWHGRQDCAARQENHLGQAEPNGEDWGLLT